MDTATVTFYGIIISEAAGILSLLIKLGIERKKTAVEQARRDQKNDDRLSQIEKKIDEHNGYAKLFAESSTETAVMRKDIEWIKKRLG